LDFDHSMSWVAIVWSMIVSACLTLATIHLQVWIRRRRLWADLLFCLASTGIAALAICEFLMMRAETPVQFATALRWLHVPTWVIVLSMVGFIRLYLRAGRRWLAWAICALRTLALPLNFLVGQNLNYLEVVRLRHIRFLGEIVSVGEGISNPWMLVGQLSLVLWLVFCLDAAITVWRRGGKRPALTLGAGMVFFTVAGTAQAVLVLWQFADWPITASFFFMGIVAAMGNEISRDTIRAAQLSDELRESKEQMTLAAEAAGVGVWEWTIGTNRVWGTDQWRRLFEFEPDVDVSYEMVFQRIHPDDRERVEAAVRHAVETATDYAGEYRVMQREGTERWITVRGRIYPEAHGKPIRMLGAAMDITARKRSEAQIEQQRNELVHVARVSAMGQLASSLAHELNQPLGAILRNAEAGELFLQEPSPDLEELRAILADIRKDDHRAGDVIDRVRDLMKDRKSERSSFDLNLLVGNVASLVRQDMDKRRVRLALEANSALLPIRGDRVQLQQALLNLLLNAMDALDGNAPERRLVTVRLRLVDAEVEVTVSDTGHGIPADKLLRVFEPFFSSKPNGLGMGLAITRKIIEAHGGRLRAENNEAGGATFTITLPAEGGNAK
jgi:two-component system, LuxR family, sensor kinase FixL